MSGECGLHDPFAPSLMNWTRDCRMMLGKAGERVPLACKTYSPFLTNIELCSPSFLTVRYGKMLNDTLVNMCGDQFSDSIPSNLPPRGHYVPTTPHPMAQPIVDHILL